MSPDLWLDTAKAEFGQIKLIDKHIDRPDRIVLAQIVIQPLRKQSALTAVIANDKARHRILRPNRRRIISLMVFSHSLVHPDEERRETGLAKNRTASGGIHPISFGVGLFHFLLTRGRQHRGCDLFFWGRGHRKWKA